MARYGGYRGGSYGRSYGRSFGVSRSGGFYNSRSGSYVSSARAHQHVGQSFGGYTKSRSTSSNNFYMKKN